MFPYSLAVEVAMRTFCDSLREKDRRRYAAVEAAKLGYGGLAYIARLLRIAPRTVRQGLQELQQPFDLPPERCRKKGVAESERSLPCPISTSPSATCCATTPLAAPSTPSYSGPT
jgi:hypothetical protein